MIVVVTGASGVGKTTLVRALEAENVPGVRCHYFDSVGVPTPDQMRLDFGSPEAWQSATLRNWVVKLAADQDKVQLAVLEGQVRPSEVRAAFKHYGVRHFKILLVDCGHEVREGRLRGGRGQPELASTQMAAWSAYLRGQADALELPILDTTNEPVLQASRMFVGLVRGWAGAHTP